MSGDSPAVVKAGAPVEFRVASDGVVGEVGMGLEPRMKEDKIWFVRI